MTSEVTDRPRGWVSAVRHAVPVVVAVIAVAAGLTLTLAMGLHNPVSVPHSLVVPTAKPASPSRPPTHRATRPRGHHHKPRTGPSTAAPTLPVAPATSKPAAIVRPDHPVVTEPPDHGGGSDDSGHNGNNGPGDE